jgi:hypothetical protein
MLEYHEIGIAENSVLFMKAYRPLATVSGLSIRYWQCFQVRAMVE